MGGGYQQDNIGGQNQFGVGKSNPNMGYNMGGNGGYTGISNSGQSSHYQNMGGRQPSYQNDLGGANQFSSQKEMAISGYGKQGFTSSNGPIKARQMDYDNPTPPIKSQYSNGGASGYGKGAIGSHYDQYEGITNSTKSSNSYSQQDPVGGSQNSNYRKAFQPNVGGNGPINVSNGFKQQQQQQQQQQSYYEPGFNDKPQRKSSQQTTASKKQIVYNERVTESRENKYSSNDLYNGSGPLSYNNANPKVSGGLATQQINYQQNIKQHKTIEEQKYDYQPQKREAPQRQRPPSGGGQLKKGPAFPKSQAATVQRNNQRNGGYGNPIEDEPVRKVPSKNYDVNNLGRDAFVPSQNLDLTPCPSCGRNFNEEAYAKHVKICKKVFVQKRKEFNSQAHRIVSSEQKQLIQRGKGRDSKPAQAQAQPKRGGYNDQPVKGMTNAQKWKMQSEQFRAAMRAARGPEPSSKGGYGGGGGGGSSYQPTPAQYDDRTECQYCGRRFNDIAAQRHIPHCEKKQKEMAMRVGPARRR